MMVTMRMLIVMIMMTVVVYNEQLCVLFNDCNDDHKLRFGLPNPYLSPGLAQVQHEIDIINMQWYEDIFEILSIVIILITLMLSGKQAWWTHPPPEGGVVLAWHSGISTIFIYAHDWWYLPLKDAFI